MLELRGAGVDRRETAPAAATGLRRFDPPRQSVQRRTLSWQGLALASGSANLWFVPGLAMALFASREASRTGAWIVPLLLLGVAPHLAFLVGIGLRRVAGHMAPPAAAVFNIVHRSLLPVAVLALNLVSLMSPFLYVGVLSWIGHIAIGWAIGDGRRQVADPLADWAASAARPRYKEGPVRKRPRMPDAFELVVRGVPRGAAGAAAFMDVQSHDAASLTAVRAEHLGVLRTLGATPLPNRRRARYGRSRSYLNE